MVGPLDALRALQAPGLAAELADRHDLGLVMVFGSTAAVRAAGEDVGEDAGERGLRDLDLAVRPRGELDVFGLLDDVRRTTVAAPGPARGARPVAR